MRNVTVSNRSHERIESNRVCILENSMSSVFPKLPSVFHIIKLLLKRYSTLFLLQERFSRHFECFLSNRRRYFNYFIQYFLAIYMCFTALIRQSRWISMLVAILRLG